MAELSASGADPASVKAALESSGTIDLLPDNALAFRAFCAIAHQWRYAPSGKLLGLDYAMVESGLRLLGITLSPGDFGKLQVIEFAILEASRQE